MIPDEIKQAIKQFINNNWKMYLVILISVIIACTSLLLLYKYNVIEQEVEALIKEETVLKVDLTP